VGGNVIFSIPADVLAAGDQYRCALSGVYDVTFSAPGATGLGVIRGRGNTQFSIVEPSSADPGVPRLDLQLITLGDGGFNITRSGDQPVNTYFVANNDPSNIAVFTVTIGNEQAARLPEVLSQPVVGVSLVHAISDPAPGTDGFPSAFADGIDLGRFIALPPPGDAIQPLERTYFLAPGEIVTIPVMERSHGMCADGSCTANAVRVFGKFLPSGTPLIGSAGSTTILNTAWADPAHATPQCELRDNVFVAPTDDALVGPGTFNGDDHLSTFGAGTIDGEPQPGLPDDDFPGRPERSPW
jgi:hypothetical protein